ncbi:MAG: ABC transporter permease [Candidatus Omnitrophica bacterium]|nr:ABC transporter permease [Candidatus Omnitrophota bacterium]
MFLIATVFKNLWRERLRSMLTILGIGISIAAFVSLRGLTDNLEKSLQTTYKARGSDLVVMEKATLDIFASSIDQNDAVALRAIAHVCNIAPVSMYFYAVKAKEYFMLFGWEPGTYLFDDLKIKGDQLRGDHDALIGSVAAKRLGKTLGDEINIRGENFRIKGIFQSLSMIEDGGIILPLATLQKIKKTPGKVTAMNLRLDIRDSVKVDAEQRQAISRQVQEAINQKFPDLEVKDVQNFISTPFTVVFSFTWAISAVVFLIVVMGIVNTMTTAVLERTKEIGILLAIGWRKSRIAWMVLLESAIYGFLGGVLGVLLGYGRMKVLLTFPAIEGFIEMHYDILFIGRSLGLSVLVGCVAGIYPALKAISIQPIEVLRNE